MLANGFNNDGYGTYVRDEERHNRRSCRDAATDDPHSDADRLFVSKWNERQSGCYDMSRSSIADGLEAMLMTDPCPSLSYSPSFSALDERPCSKPVMDYDVKNGGGGDLAILEPVYALNKPEGQLGNRSDSDRSSFSVEPEMLCPPQKKKRVTSSAMELRPTLNRMHNDASIQPMMFQTRQGSYSSPIFIVQDSGSSYRIPEGFVEVPRNPHPHVRCIEAPYSHPPVTLERALVSTPPGVPYSLAEAQSAGWLTTEPQMHRIPETAQNAHARIVASNGKSDERAWSVYRSFSAPGHLQPYEQVTQCQTELSRQLYVYSGRPVESLIEAEHGELFPSTKRRVHRKRENLPKESTAVLKKWLLTHLMMPYPVNEEKVALCCATGLEISQINNWFINARVRIWKPLITKIFRKYQTKLKTLAEESGDENLSKRIGEADKSTTMGMLTLLTSLPEARRALDRAAEDSVSSLLTH